MTALLPLLLPLALGTASAEVPALASPPPEQADLVEVHLGAGTPGVRLVCKPPASAGPDAQPYVVEIHVPAWPLAAAELSTAPEPVTIELEPMALEPIATMPAMLTAPATLASGVPTASYATQPIEPERPQAPAETAFLRHAPVDDLEPPIPPAEPPLGAASVEPQPAPAPLEKEVEPPPSWASAADNFEKACDSGYAQACTALADMVASGQAGAPDIPRAKELYERGCDRGDHQACAAIAPIDTPSAQALTVPTTLTAAAPALAPAVAPQAPQAMAQAQAPAQAPAFAVERGLFDACQQGQNAACNELGERHTHGEGVSQDYERAAKLFQRACAGGEMPACTNLGILYKVGEGVSQDEMRAERLFALACNGGAGDERACGLADE